jgi:flagellar assembly protein FliH
LSRIIKARQSCSESVCAFSFAEIASPAGGGDFPTEESAEDDSSHERGADSLDNLELLIQQRLLEAERRAQELEQEGYEKGYAQGLKDGTEFGRKSMQVARDQLEALLERLTSLPATVLADYRDWLISSCLAVSKHIARGELRTNPRILIQLMEEMLAEAQEAQGITLHLHPKDLDLLRNHSALEEIRARADKSFTIRPDERMSRGGCRLESSLQLMDGSLESRLALIEKSIARHNEAEEHDPELNIS